MIDGGHVGSSALSLSLGMIADSVPAPVSRAPNAAGGGNLGLLTEGGLPENLDEVIFALSADE